MDISFEHGGFKKSAIADAVKKLSPYLLRLQGVVREKDWSVPESFMNLPADRQFLRNAQAALREKGLKSVKYIVVVGIGGSNLGAKAVYDARFGYFDVLEPGRFPKMIFLDTDDEDFALSFRKFLKTKIRNQRELLIVFISKSGTTTEAAVNAEMLFGVKSKILKNLEERTIVITDRRSKLWEDAADRGITALTIPAKVGGRFSVFSAAGILPLLACSIDVRGLCRGAAKAIDVCVRKNTALNPAMISAALLYLNWKSGKSINDNFFFHPELESLGKWCRGLLAESIGKSGKGITPTVTIGSTDLHSMGQLYLGGAKNRFTSLYWSLKADKSVKIPKKEKFPNLVKGIKGKSFHEIMDAIFKGVKDSYRKRKSPFVEITLKDLKEQSLGELMQFKMIEVIFLAQLMGVNAFDQPNVEEYKKETRRILRR